MATEKILIFDEAGNAKRMKVRIARFLDNEPVTATDKENIRTTLNVDGSQSGTFTTPLSVTSASDSSFTGGGSVGIGTASPGSLLSIQAAGTQESLISARTNNGSGGGVVIQTDASDDGLCRMYDSTGAVQVQFDTDGGDNYIAKGNVGIGTASPSTNFHSTASSGSATNTTIENTHSTDTFANLKSTASSLFIGNKNGSFAVQTSGNGYSDKLIIDSFGGLDIRSVGGATAALFPSAASVNGITALPSATGTPFLVGRDTGSLRSAHFAGNLKFDSGYGIDFGSTNSRTGVTVSASTLSHYEEGSWTPTIGTIQAGPTAGASAVYSGKYVRIGQLVYCSMDLDFDDGGTSVAVDDRFAISGLPLAVNPSLPTYTGSGSIFIYLSSGAGNNATGTVAVSSTGDSAICYITHTDGTTNWGNNLRAIFTYHTDA